MKMRVLKIVFWFYYKRVPVFFHQWPPLKSIKLLVANYEHNQLLLKNANDNFRSALNELDNTRMQLASLKMQQIANPDTIDQLNKMFGMDYDNPKDN